MSEENIFIDSILKQLMLTLEQLFLRRRTINKLIGIMENNDNVYGFIYYIILYIILHYIDRYISHEKSNIIRKNILF
jgi:hypothetical protein